MIGLDYLWQFINPLKCVAHNSLIGQFGVFGWVISGSYINTKSNTNKNVKKQICCVSVNNDDLHKFRAMDVVGVSPKETRDVSPAVENFKQTFKFENYKYSANLLRKMPKFKLVNNLPIVRKRQIATNKHLSLDLKNHYYGFFKKCEEQSKLENCHKGVETNQDALYLPSFPVIKETRALKKVRPVFDGSVSSINSMSLNDTF